MNVDIAHASQWRDANNYAFVSALPPAGCAWEFLRRNPDYQKAWRAFSSEADLSSKENADPSVWGLVRFESPEHDARSANVFWHRSLSREVLPLIASEWAFADQHPKLSLIGLQCRMTVQSGRAGERHILFAEDGRFFQLEVQGIQPIETAHLTTEVVFSRRLISARVQAVKRFSDVVTHCRLRACLYPPDERAARFSRVLQVLDGWNARASYRDMASVIFGDARVSADWHAPHLRDHLRRALRSGRALMMHGYRRLLQ